MSAGGMQGGDIRQRVQGEQGREVGVGRGLGGVWWEQGGAEWENWASLWGAAWAGGLRGLLLTCLHCPTPPQDPNFTREEL